MCPAIDFPCECEHSNPDSDVVRESDVQRYVGLARGLIQGGGQRRGVGENVSLHNIAITNIVWCMAYKGGGRLGGVYCATVVQ